jgi:hypothetical protein
MAQLAYFMSVSRASLVFLELESIFAILSILLPRDGTRGNDTSPTVRLSEQHKTRTKKKKKKLKLLNTIFSGVKVVNEKVLR